MAKPPQAAAWSVAMGPLWSAAYRVGLVVLAAVGWGCGATRSLAQADIRLDRGIDKECLAASLAAEPHVVELRDASAGGRVAYSFDLVDPVLMVVDDPERVEPGIPSFTVSQRPVSRAWNLAIASSFLAFPETEPAWREAAIRRQQEILRNLVGRCLGTSVEFDRPAECSAEAQYFGSRGRTQTTCVVGRILGEPSP